MSETINSNATSPVLTSPQSGNMTPSTTTTTTTTNTSGGNSENSSFSNILDTWKIFDIEKKKIDMGDFVAQIGNSKDECLKSRKVLAKQTQDFKKFTDEEKIKQFSQLLKLYQEEVDKLTKRSKFSETCFLGLYKDISEMSDPVPALTAALEEASKVDNSGKLEIENKKLQNELADFKKEFQEIQNQEVTIRRLEDKVKDQESKLELMINEKVGNRESEVRLEMQDKINLLQQDKQELARHNSSLQEECNKLSKLNYEAQSQLMEMRNKQDNDGHSKQSEIDLLTNELELVSGKLSQLLVENQAIREESQREKSSLNVNIKRISDLELELLSRENDISKFVDLNAELRNTVKQEQDKVGQLEDSIRNEQEQRQKLELYIRENPSPIDYENMKKELVALQSIVGSEELTNPNADKLLKEKNRQLESESTRMRLQLSDLENQVTERSIKIQELEDTIEKQSQLIVNIEKDLNILNLNQQQQQFIQQQMQQQNLSEILIQNSNPITNTLNSSLNSISSPLVQNTSSSNNNSNKQEIDKTLEIVIGQRDRQKVKIEQLEYEKSQLEKKIENSNQEIVSLKNDNIKLYEKIRFLQTFDKNSSRNANSNNNNGYNSKRNTNTGSFDIESNRPDPEERYGKLYEESINPFNSFNKKEKNRKYKEMNTAERVILNGSRFFLSNKYSRLFLFVYSILLHLLVFVTLYKLAVTTTEIHDQNFDSPNILNPNLPLQDNTNDNNDK
ncbi:CCAAT displacement protein [Tieghemostelium lacteum]|uniref:Protein CASP n=1 Tax=Tieghemostelium lacteum TaxID=361077 RepID=A0A151Z550_TIELA|nr:CCAAT displacement protein [Tieghemostelium lacteum]|eukprot:KYQ89065.1 CCAAT displacement protein [Tieghemostelium lacteum]